MASIYEIYAYNNSKSDYAKNEIVSREISIAETRFYYALQDGIPAGVAPESANSYWGGRITFINKDIPHFFWVPDYGVSIGSEPKVEVIQFGDGYEQRATQNISADLIKLSLSFDNRDEREATAIAHFLHARGAKDSFAFTPPSPYGSVKKFVCRNWDVTMTFNNNYGVKCDFEEVVS